MRLLKGRARPTHGYSVLELMVAVGIMAAGSGMAVLSTQSVLPGMRADAGLTEVARQMRVGRQLAVGQRRNIQIQFLGNNQIRLIRNEVPAALGPTVLSTVVLENNVQYMLFPTVPDTPAGFGRNAPLAFGGTATMTFLSNGSLVDAAGGPLNGTVFLGVPNQPLSARAVTILGATGLIRAYKWNGARWVY